ncbi:hypothetical protein [Mesorhizobium sp. M4A.F.Ca.ET.090.04.2.1]|nr:hypothetical protein [Mesorhizobium sp. M4A.F.Ca.ET.090.04.2.1]
MSVGVLYRKADETLSAWYLSNGNDFAFVTYVGLGEESEIMNEELDEVRAVVSSISF